MVVNKRKKAVRMRGSKTHGWGSMKKHRGAGNRGGRGRAGTGKRGDATKPSFWKERYFGKRGFVRKGIKRIVKPINASYFEENINELLSKKIIEKQGDFYSIDIAKLGFNKLLGNGKITKKFRINAQFASKSAVEKVKKAGGEVIIKS